MNCVTATDEITLPLIFTDADGNVKFKKFKVPGNNSKMEESSWSRIPSIKIANNVVVGKRSQGTDPCWLTFDNLTFSRAKSIGAIIECTSGTLIVRSKATGLEIVLQCGEVTIALKDPGCNANVDENRHCGFAFISDSEDECRFETREIVWLPPNYEIVES